MGRNGRLETERNLQVCLKGKGARETTVKSLRLHRIQSPIHSQ